MHCKEINVHGGYYKNNEMIFTRGFVSQNFRTQNVFRISPFSTAEVLLVVLPDISNRKTRYLSQEYLALNTWNCRMETMKSWKSSLTSIGYLFAADTALRLPPTLGSVYITKPDMRAFCS